MSVISACTRLSTRRPIHHHLGQAARVHLPLHERAGAHFDVEHQGVEPSASFFDMMEEAISGMDSTVAVASRSA